jgi:hypothetical protein
LRQRPRDYYRPARQGLAIIMIYGHGYFANTLL